MKKTAIFLVVALLIVALLPLSLFSYAGHFTPNVTKHRLNYIKIVSAEYTLKKDKQINCIVYLTYVNFGTVVYDEEENELKRNNFHVSLIAVLGANKKEADDFYVNFKYADVSRIKITKYYITYSNKNRMFCDGEITN